MPVQTEEKPAPLHLAFIAENRQQVEDFYRAAMEAGGKDNGAPGLCPEITQQTMQHFVIGPDTQHRKWFATNRRSQSFHRGDVHKRGPSMPLERVVAHLVLVRRMKGFRHAVVEVWPLGSHRRGSSSCTEYRLLGGGQITGDSRSCRRRAAWVFVRLHATNDFGCHGCY